MSLKSCCVSCIENYVNHCFTISMMKRVNNNVFNKLLYVIKVSKKLIPTIIEPSKKYDCIVLVDDALKIQQKEALMCQ